MWAAHYIDDEKVSREEFFRRTMPSDRLTLDKWQACSGGPPIYANAEEWRRDMEAIRLENHENGRSGLDPDGIRKMVAAEARMWAESEHGRAAGESASMAMYRAAGIELPDTRETPVD